MRYQDEVRSASEEHLFSSETTCKFLAERLEDHMACEKGLFIAFFLVLVELWRNTYNDVWIIAELHCAIYYDCTYPSFRSPLTHSSTISPGSDSNSQPIRSVSANPPLQHIPC